MFFADWSDTSCSADWTRIDLHTQALILQFPLPPQAATDVALLREWHRQLLEAAAQLNPARLDERAGSGAFTVSELISGAAAHDLYHAGQIRLLRRMHEGAVAQTQ
jgi:hypothetical protein